MKCDLLSILISLLKDYSRGSTETPFYVCIPFTFLEILFRICVFYYIKKNLPRKCDANASSEIPALL